MLSIGKLVAGQAKYYLDQAEGRVDVVESIGDGAEEYYVGGSEPRGEWFGTAAAELGLAGPVEGTQLRQLLAGLDPRDGSLLRSAAHPVRVAAFDLTFSAPKSVSVLFGVGDAKMRDQVRAAHDRAAREAIGYLERAAAAVRRGSGGSIVEEASGLVAAGFRHRTSRAGDPQLHTHVLVANLGRGIDGRWSALDGRRLYAHARTASFIYQAVLRSELTRTLGVEWTRVRGGIGEVVGVPLAIRRTFSRRRAEIEAALDAHGTSGIRAAEAAALATRRAKDAKVRRDDLQLEWRARAHALGFGPEELARVVARAQPPRHLDDWQRIVSELAGPLGLTRQAATFSRREVIQAICEAQPSGVVDARTLESMADAFLASTEAVPLVPNGAESTTGESFRRRDGRIIPASVERLRYSTPAHLELEQRLVDRVAASRRRGVAVAPARDVDRALAARPTLSSEQRDVVRRLCLDGDGVAVVAGRAGTGKTFALSAAREAWQAAGHPVLGVAIARRAARELQEGAGIQSTSVAALLRELRLGTERLPSRSVLVVDEAGMVPTRELSELLDRVERARGKLVLVGDHRQLPELEAGGAFRGLVQRGLAVELRDNLRQVHGWERRALDDLRAGRVEAALAAYQARDRVTVEPMEDRLQDRLVRDWLSADDPDRAVMIAHRRVDVRELNARARAHLTTIGEIHGPELSLPGGDFAVGDRVVIKRNDLRRGANNGDRGRVVGVAPVEGSLTVRCGDRRIVLDRGFLAATTAEGEPTLLHGYAITGHVAQGLTVDQSFVLASEGMTREWAYVALSRGRQSNRLYIAGSVDRERAEFAPTTPDTRDPIGRLAERLQTSGAQVLAIDSGRPDGASVDAAKARHDLARATRERAEIESSRRRWLPGALRRAQDREADAGARLARVERLAAERRHGERPFITRAEQDARTAQLSDRVAERVAERDRHERDLGRGL